MLCGSSAVSAGVTPVKRDLENRDFLDDIGNALQEGADDISSALNDLGDAFSQIP